MKSAPVFILGLFLALAISFGGIVLGSHAQLGRLAPYYDDGEGQAYPQRTAGIAARGQYVYADLGCAACHTQQVRRPGFGSDDARGWGERQSVARDFIHQARPQLGASRIGPDLANYGARKPAPTEADIYKLLYEGNARHPSYRFLFEPRTVVGETATTSVATANGQQVVPSERAHSLAAYLLSLNTTYSYPEARPVAPVKKEAPAAHGAVPEKHEVQPIPTAAPDEKKPLQKK